MGAFTEFRSSLRRASTVNTNTSFAEESKKELDDERAVQTAEKLDETLPERVSEDVQKGVQDVEAVTLTWSKTTLIAVFLKYVL